MVQTSPAAAMLGVGANGKAAASSAKNGDDGAFSREFEQVSRSAESHKDAPSSAADDTVNETSGTSQGSASQETAERDHQEPAANDAAADEEALAAGGKDLPPIAALELEDGEADEQELTAEQDDDVAGMIQALLPQETKPLATAAPTEAKPNVVHASALPNGESSVEPLADESLSFSEQRLRDLGLNLANLGKDGGDGATAQQGKSDNALYTLVSGNRGASAFGEVLNVSSAAVASAAQPAQPSTATLPAQMSIAVPLQQSGWDHAMGERVVWMARSNVQQAQIHLNPRELGPIEIKISVQNDQTHVNFVAHHATTRDAIEAALPRLREMLGEQGLNLGQADVSQHSFGDSQRQAAVADQGRGLNNGPNAEVDANDEADVAASHTSRISSNAVDYFA